MKKLPSRTLVLTITYTVLCFIGFLITAFLSDDLPELIETDVFSYRMLLGLTSFFDWFPSIIISVSFISFSWFFGHSSIKNYDRFSLAQMKNYKKVLFVTSTCVVFIFIVIEVFMPLAMNAKNLRINRNIDYNWSIKESQKSFQDDNIYDALFYVESALSLYPTSEKAVTLKEMYERASAGSASIPLPNIATVANVDPLVSDSLNALNLLERARKDFSAKNYFDAHYYASLALEIGGPNNANSVEMQRIAVDSWNILSTWSGFETDEGARIFALKRDGYAALMDGDALKAYYIYLDLYKINDFDPDIIRYYALATEALLNEYFFIDESVNLAYFEKVHNIEFSLARDDGGKDEIRIRGITNVSNTGDYLKYLRDYSSTSYDKNGVFLYSVTIPYVKLIAEPVTSFGVDNARKFGIDDSEAFIPRLLLTSVDRNTMGLVSMPVYTAGAQPAPRDTVTVIPMTLDDFSLVSEAAVGPQYMNLASLFSFVSKAEQYGFDSRLYSTFFMKRVCYPFLLFAIFIFLAIQAWNFRLDESVEFKFSWVIIFPIFTILAQLLGVVIDYGMNLVYFFVSQIAENWHLIVAIFIFLSLIIILSLRFLSLYIDSATNPDEK